MANRTCFVSTAKLWTAYAAFGTDMAILLVLVVLSDRLTGYPFSRFARRADRMPLVHVHLPVRELSYYSTKDLGKIFCKSVGMPRVELGLPAPKAGVLPAYSIPLQCSSITLACFFFTYNSISSKI